MQIQYNMALLGFLPASFLHCLSFFFKAWVDGTQWTRKGIYRSGLYSEEDVLERTILKFGKETVTTSMKKNINQTKKIGLSWSLLSKSLPFSLEHQYLKSRELVFSGQWLWLQDICTISMNAGVIIKIKCCCLGLIKFIFIVFCPP